MSYVNKVCYNIDQTGDTTSAEKAQARANIGAGTGNSNITRYDISGNDYDVEQLKIYQRSVSNAEFIDGMNTLGSTVPTPSMASNEGKVPVAYYRDGRGYFLLEQYKDPRFPDSSSSDYNKILTVNAGGYAVWQTPSSGPGVTMASFQTTKTIHIPGGNSSMLTDLYKIYDLAPKTAVNMTVFVRDMDRNGLQMMGIALWCGSTHISANAFTRGTATSIAHALPVCYYNNTDTPIEIKIGFNGTFAEEDLNIEMMGFTITQEA